MRSEELLLALLAFLLWHYGRALERRLARLDQQLERYLTATGWDDERLAQVAALWPELKAAVRSLREKPGKTVARNDVGAFQYRQFMLRYRWVRRPTFRLLSSREQLDPVDGRATVTAPPQPVRHSALVSAHALWPVHR